MKSRDYTRLIGELAEAYTRHSPKSAALNQNAKRVLVDGGSHALRLTQPFPPRIASAKGAWLEDEDGHSILDFWQGHHANILGNNPKIITSVLARAFEEGYGLQTGFTDRLQWEAAEILCQRSGAEQVRFTTSGSLATMYAILLARAYTQREIIMKVGGGWHGAQPWGLKGVKFGATGSDGFQMVDTEGLPSAVTDAIIVTSFNDTEILREHFHRYGDRLACLIFEPFLGGGGYIPATMEYLQTARQLADQYGVVLIFDEVIAGFRFHAGDLGSLYGVQPDLTTFGKIVGGGMPVAAVAGRADIMGLAGREKGHAVKFSGGTYSAHPASLLAAKTMMTHLVTYEDEIYPYLADLGEKTRRAIEEAFAQEGISAHCTGYDSEVLPGSSMVNVHFPYDDGCQFTKPEDISDPAKCDVMLRGTVLQLALLLEDVFVVQGLGSLSTAHTGKDIDMLSEAYNRVARRVKAHR